MNSLSKFSALAALFLGLSLPAIAQQKLGDEKYQPSVGQEGKDVIWVPTSDELVLKMLETAKVTSKDLVYDLGCGDGKIPIAAASKFGARAVCIEYNPDMAALATRNAQRAGVSDKVKVIRGDIFVENFSDASVVTLYLLPDLNLKLRPIILKMKPGTRVVSHAFNMGDWEPDERIKTALAQAYYWVVPASAAGEWSLEGIEGNTKISLSLVQRYQRVGGNITIGKSSQPLLGARVEGDKLTFSYIDSSNTLFNVTATIDGKTMSGQVQGGSRYDNFKGTRR